MLTIAMLATQLEFNWHFVVHCSHSRNILFSIVQSFSRPLVRKLISDILLYTASGRKRNTLSREKN